MQGGHDVCGGIFNCFGQCFLHYGRSSRPGGDEGLVDDSGIIFLSHQKSRQEVCQLFALERTEHGNWRSTSTTAVVEVAIGAQASAGAADGSTAGTVHMEG